MELDLRWATPTDYNKLLDFYVTELVKYPDYIAHPELREGIKRAPENWMPHLKTEAAKYFTETFDPKTGITLALLETQVKVNGAKKGSKKTPPKLPQVVAFVRIRKDRQAATILDILVAEHLRNQGWGSQLLGFIQKHMEESGVVEVNLSVSVQNADGARFFVRNGYMPYATFFAKGLTPPPPRVHRIATASGFRSGDESED